MPELTLSAQEARELLELQPGYEKADLSSAYRRMVRSVHPDLLVDASERETRDASDRLAQVNLANEVLQRSLRLNARGPEPVPNGPFEAPQSFSAPASAAAPTSSTPFAQPAPPAAAPTPRLRTVPRWQLVAAVGASVLVLVGFIGFCLLIGR